MSEALWFLGGVLATVVVETVALVVVAIKRARRVSGQNSREPIKENIVTVLGQE